jgi:exonuclease SbcD
LKFVHTADTHLGFEFSKILHPHPAGRLKRAASIRDNFHAVVRHALEIEADLFIHSGDLFNKHYIPEKELFALIEPLLDLSRRGVRVLILPGNHERSAFPFDLFHGASGVYVFDRPKSLSFELGGYAVGIAGFPFIRENSGGVFPGALEETGYAGMRSDLNILVTHQAFDGATVGPGNYVFRSSRRDTVARASIPGDFDYVAAGHIHRVQSLPHPLKPSLNVVYPGSIQRMSFAEMQEEKCFVEGEILGDRIETRFLPLPAYDMEIVEIEAAGMTASECEESLLAQSWRLSEDLVIRFNLIGGLKAGDYPCPDFDRVREALSPVLECQFALKTQKRWILR